MARKKKQWHATVKDKIQWSDNECTKGRIRFKFLGLPKDFVSKTLPAKQLMEHAERIARDIRKLEECPLDPDTQTCRYPFTFWQLEQIRKTHKEPLLPEIERAFSNTKTFEQVLLEKPTNDAVSNRLSACIAIYSQFDFYYKDIRQASFEDVYEAFRFIKEDALVTQGPRKGERLARNTAASYQKTLSGLFTYACQSGYLLVHPVLNNRERLRSVVVNFAKGSKKNYLTHIQCELMKQEGKKRDALVRHEWTNTREGNRKAGRRKRFARAELLIRLGIFTGARKEDLHGARWDEFNHIQSNHCTWTFKQRKHKAKDDYHDPVAGQKYIVTFNDFHADPELLQMLRDAKEESQSEYVFENLAGEQTSRSTFDRTFRSIVSSSNEQIEEMNAMMSPDDKPIDPIKGSIHTMRHTVVSHVVSATNGNWEAASKRVGHVSMKTTLENYGDLMEEAREKAKVQTSEFVAAGKEAALHEMRRLRVRSVK